MQLGWQAQNTPVYLRACTSVSTQVCITTCLLVHGFAGVVGARETTEGVQLQPTLRCVHSGRPVLIFQRLHQVKPLYSMCE